MPKNQKIVNSKTKKNILTGSFPNAWFKTVPLTPY